MPKGFWRSSNLSAYVLACLNEDACPGGFGSEESGASPCAKGYGGNLCDKCVQDEEGNYYERVTPHACSKCPPETVNALRISGMIILGVLYVAGLIW